MSDSPGRILKRERGDSAGSASDHESVSGGASRKQRRVAPTKKVDDISGPSMQRGDIATRVLLSSSEMARVIGRGGEHINKIRTTTGAIVKACDVECEDKVAVIIGDPQAVAAAFEQVLDKIISPGSDHMTLRFLVPHEHVGRVVGLKGSNINEMRVVARASQVSVEKQATKLGGMTLRVMTVEGTIHSVAHVHALYHRLFDAVIALPGDVSASDRGHHVSRDQPHYDSFQSFERRSAHEPAPRQDSVTYDGLLQRGVLADTVQQLQAMGAYLENNFSVGLVFVNKNTPPPLYQPQSSVAHTESYARHSHSHGHELDRQRPGGSPRSGCKFLVPASVCGGLIGRGGELLKALGTEYRVHIDITRQVLADGTREVIINPLHNSGGDAEVFRCKERMLQHVDSILEREREA